MTVSKKTDYIQIGSHSFIHSEIKQIMSWQFPSEQLPSPGEWAAYRWSQAPHPRLWSCAGSGVHAQGEWAAPGDGVVGVTTGDFEITIWFLDPIGSMYAIYGNIYHQYTPNVSIYTLHGSYGIWLLDVISILNMHYFFVNSHSYGNEWF